MTEVRKEDEGELSNLAVAFRTHFNENKELEKQIGGFRRGAKSDIKYKKAEAEKEKEAEEAKAKKIAKDAATRAAKKAEKEAAKEKEA